MKDLIAKLLGNKEADYTNATVDANTIKQYNKTRNKAHTGTFCHAPSVNMLFGQDGRVRSCCHNLDYALGKYPEQSIKEIWNSPEAQKMREYMKSVDLHHGCEICENDIVTHSFDEVKARYFDNIPRRIDYPTMMEFLITNTCNYECIMCQGEYSSLIRKNREKLPAINSPYDAAFVQQLAEFIPNLHETRFSGSGEAFAIDMNYEIWEMIIRLNPNCLIMVQTNGSFLNSRIKDLLSRGNFKIGVSLDSLKKEVFEAIRVHANFDRVMENIEYFNQYCKSKNHAFTLAFCVMRQNWRELPDFVKFCNSKNIWANLHKVWFPIESSLHNLSYDELSEIHNYLSSFNIPANTALERVNVQSYKHIVFSVGLWKEDALKNKGNNFIEGSAKKWRDKTFQPSTEATYIDSLESDKLMPFLLDKLKTYLEQSNTPNNEIADTVAMCHEKISAVVSNYQNAEQRTNILKQICQVPSAEMLKSIRHSSVDVLKESAKVFLSN